MDVSAATSTGATSITTLVSTGKALLSALAKAWSTPPLASQAALSSARAPSMADAPSMAIASEPPLSQDLSQLPWVLPGGTTQT
jgi:hypothetical protein